MIALEAVDLVKRYTSGDGSEIIVLNGVRLQVSTGEMVAVIGASGAGKSTLLHLLGALDRPTAGFVTVAGMRLRNPLEESPLAGGRGIRGIMSRLKRGRQESEHDLELSRFRNRSIGFIFQFHHLLREFSALENVMMPLRLAGWETTRAHRRASELLDRVGLGSRIHHRPSELSGGEQQRTAVARALAAEPVVLIADEPSGNLDYANSERLHDLFVEVARDFDVATIVATHNRSLAARADRVLLLEGGQLQDAGFQEAVL